MSNTQVISLPGANPEVPTQFVTDDGTAIPDANVLEVLGTDGISTAGSGNVLTIQGPILQGSGQTVDNATNAILTFNPTDPSGFQIEGLVCAYDAANNLQFGGKLVASGKVSAATAALVGTPDFSGDGDAAILGASATVCTSGTTFTVCVTGVIGYTLNWTVKALYVITT